MSRQPAPRPTTPISRRAALRAGVAGTAGASLTAAATADRANAREATPTGMRTEHLEVDVVVSNPVTITLAGVARHNGATISISMDPSTQPVTPAAPRLGNTAASGPGLLPPLTRASPTSVSPPFSSGSTTDRSWG